MTKKQKREQKRQKRTSRILNKISYELYSKSIDLLSPWQMDRVVNSMLYNPDTKGRSFRQVKS